MLPKKIKGRANFFSWLYRPGATNIQIWYINQGSANNTAAIISTLSGTKNGENTPTAISLAPGGICALIGIAIRSIKPLGPGYMANRAAAMAKPYTQYSRRSRNSIKWVTKGCSVPASSSSLLGSAMV